MGRPPRWVTARTGRPAMRSPGRPPVARREHQQRFWAAIARGMTSEDAGIEAGVSAAVGTRWFRSSGGMRPISLEPHTGRYLSFAEREEIAVLRAQNVGVRAIARRLGRSPSTISRELRRNAATRGGCLDYRASTAQWHADRRARRPKTAKLAANDALRQYVQDRLAGTLTTTDGTTVPGPDTRWIGRRHGRRQDRRWARSWSPEQIAHRLPLDFPDDESMRISHEAIYQALYIHGRGALRRGADGLPAHRARVARPPGPDAGPRQEVRDFRGPDQRAPSRGRRPRRSRALGGRSHPRPGQLRHRHASRAHHPLHHAVAPAAHGRTRPAQAQERAGAGRARR